MFISGFTIIRNAVINDYPIKEAILSILPIVDEMIVLIGDSQDETESLIKSIDSPKIKIHHSVWDTSQRKGGYILATETNKAMQYVSKESTWLCYIQGDEVLPEKYHAEVLNKTKLYKHDEKVEGLLFKYLHFYGTYDYVGDSRKWYKHEVRIIKNNPEITSYRDAQGFRKNNQKISVKPIEAFIHHYGWVKSPEAYKVKVSNVGQFWDNKQAPENVVTESNSIFNFDDFDSLKKFDEPHPGVMHERIKNKNWNLTFDVSKKKFSLKDKCLYWFEKKTGIRLFEFRNFKVI
jgi:hypothetical protein